MKQNKRKYNQDEIELLQAYGEITGKEFIELLRYLGITMARYGTMCKPPLQSASGINNYRYKKKIPFRLLAPLLEFYPVQFLVNLANGKKIEITSAKQLSDNQQQ
jgi:hypothetical protein